MANTFTLKRNTTRDHPPSTSDLIEGELGINTYDGYLFAEIDQGSPEIQIWPSAQSDWASPTNGFLDRTEVTLSWDDVTRTLTVTPSGADFVIFSNNQRYITSSTPTKQIADSEGLHYLYFDGNGALQETAAFSSSLIEQYCLVSIVYWDATNNKAVLTLDERHGKDFPSIVHLWAHSTFSAQYESGLGLGNLTVDGDGSLDTHAQFSVADGIIWDEDIQGTIQDDSPQDLSTAANIPVIWKEGASGEWRIVAATGFPIATSAGIPQWNEWTGTVWQSSNLSNNSFMLMHYFATNDFRTPIIGIMGEVEYSTKSAARAGAETELLDITAAGLPGPEFVAIASVIWQYKSTFTNTPSAIIVSTDLGDEWVDWRNISVIAGGGSSSNHSHSFLSLSDSPSAYTGEATKVVVVNATEDGVEFDDISWSQVSAGHTAAAHDGLDVIAAQSSELLSGLEDTDEFLLSDSGVIKRMDASVMVSYLESQMNHDNLVGFVANEHIDWTNASDNFKTTGDLIAGGTMKYHTADASLILGHDSTLVQSIVPDDLTSIGALILVDEGYIGSMTVSYHNSAFPFFSGRRARGTYASPTAVTNNSTLLRFGGGGHDGTSFPSSNQVSIEFEAAENFTPTAKGSKILFKTTKIGTTSTIEAGYFADYGGLVLTPTSSTWALLVIAGNYDVDFGFSYNGSIHGHYWRYKGSGTGNANALEMWTQGQTGADVQVYNQPQDGIRDFLVAPTINSVAIATQTWAIEDTTDIIKDTHIDWGTGATQVSTDDIPEGSINKFITSSQETNWDAAYTHSLVTTGNPHSLDFLDLSDTPSSYSGQGLKGVRVVSGETGLEFYDVGIGTDEKVGVDSGATAGYLGAAFNDGVLRTGSNLSYVDGGDYVTLDVDSTKATNWDTAYSHSQIAGNPHNVGWSHVSSGHVASEHDGMIFEAIYAGRVNALTHITNPGGASYNNETSTLTGAIKITLPQSWTSTMMQFYIDVFDYNNEESFTVMCAGYNYSPSTQWVNTTAIVTGADTGRELTVRFGHDGSVCCVYIGELTSTWDYLKVRVRDFMAGHTGDSVADWDDGWSIGLEASAFGTITKTVTDTFGTADWNKIVNTPTTLTGYGITDALPLSGGTLTGDVIFNEQIFLQDGTALDPALAFTNSSSTGLILSAANAIGWVCGGTEYLTLATTSLTLNQDYLYINKWLMHNGDGNTYLEFLEDEVTLVAGGINFVKCDEDVQNSLYFGQSATDVNIYFYSAVNTAVFIQGSDGKVGFGGQPSPLEVIDVIGNIAVSGTVDSVDIASFKSSFDTHEANTSNPHSVDWSDVSAGHTAAVHDGLDIIAAQGTALISGLISTDELLISDGGIAKRMDISVLEDYFDNIYALDSGVVHDTGDETVAGIKTFSSFIITPSSAPTTNYQIANKKYVDDSIAASGGGDMLKSVYDPGDNGRVDDAEQLYDGTNTVTAAQARSHLDDVSNPHSVTYTQVGAIQDAIDVINDTHIDWGTGVNQVSADDIPDGVTYIIPTATQETNWDTAYTHSQVATGNPHSVTYTEVGAIKDDINTVDTTHIDWGSGVDQIDLDEVPDGSTYIRYTPTEQTKLSGIETGADVTDITNVTAAGAVMDGDFGVNGLMRRTGVGTYDTITDNSSNWDSAYGWGNHSGLYLSLAGGTITGDITLSSSTPYLYFIDTDTGADSYISADSATGSLVISADFNMEVASSQIDMQVDNVSVLQVKSGGRILASSTGGFFDTPADGAFSFRNRTDEGLFDSGYSVSLMAPDDVIVHIDSNNNGTTNVFAVVANQATAGDEVTNRVFSVKEDGLVNLYGNLTTTGLLDGVDLAQLKSDFDTHEANVSNPHSVDWSDVSSGHTAAVHDGLNIISSQSSELLVAPADTDQLLIDDGGVVKKIDMSYINTYIQTSSGIADLNDTTITTPVTGDLLSYQVSGKWENKTFAELKIVLKTDVDDVSVNGATTDPISSNWAYDHENDAAQHHTRVDTLDDTNIATPADDQVLVYSSGKLTNRLYPFTLGMGSGRVNITNTYWWYGDVNYGWMDVTRYRIIATTTSSDSFKYSNNFHWLPAKVSSIRIRGACNSNVGTNGIEFALVHIAHASTANFTLDEVATQLISTIAGVNKSDEISIDVTGLSYSPGDGLMLMIRDPDWAAGTTKIRYSYTILCNYV